jgi:glutamyl-tRNA synthetase
MSVRVRFAPSPTGKIHVGNARTTLLNALMAKKHQGTFVVRFEDTDMVRSVEASEDNILDSLDWLGLTPDESVRTPGAYGPYRDSQRAVLGEYRAAVDKLVADGRAYECFVSKEELDLLRKIQLNSGKAPGYDNRHRNLTPEQKATFRAQGRVPVVRFKLNDGLIKFNDLVRGESVFEANKLGGDPVIVRSNGVPTFVFAGAVNDIAQKITHVIRGEDHVTNTAAQVQIFEALGHPAPVFAHLPLLRDSDGGKLSKRLDSLSIAQLRAQGYLPKAIVSYLAVLGTGLPPEPASLDELAAKFDFANIGRAPVRFDLEQVDRLNGIVLRALSWDEVKPHVAAFLPTVADPRLPAFWEAVKGNLTLLSELAAHYDMCFGKIPAAELPAADAAYVALAATRLPAEPYTPATWKEWVDSLKAESGRKGKDLFMPLRLALTGVEHGPDMATLLPLMGEQTARNRLAHVTARHG